jgi:hypothetical protein
LVARFLLNENEYKVPVPPGAAEIILEKVDFFHSPIHGQELHHKQFKSWLENTAGDAKLDIHDSEIFQQEYKNLIIKVACGVDIWSLECTRTPFTGW